jgi:dihydrofolate reductase
MDVVLVAAVGANGVIGSNNALPWRLKSDLAHFRTLTLGKPVVMGRKTFLSLGKPLNGRTNVVLSRDPGFAHGAVVAARDFNSALEAAKGDALRRNGREIMVIGGAVIFAAFMDVATRLEITHVHLRPDGDTVFPAIDPAIWRETGRQAHARGPADDADFDVVTYRRAGF